MDYSMFFLIYLLVGINVAIVYLFGVDYAWLRGLVDSQGNRNFMRISIKSASKAVIFTISVLVAALIWPLIQWRIILNALAEG
tara:strand:+ start:391 stop:639 length:249 start_codon:yes stop_codon:yes gene_type:complete